MPMLTTRRICLILLLVLGARPAQADDAAYAEKAAAIVRSYVDAGEFSGSVLVAVDGRPILRQGFGLADRDRNVANTPDTKFSIGSLTKQFTAAAILQLAERGKLGLDDPISKYYAAAPEAWRRITLRHLLAMRSGIPNHNAFVEASDGQWDVARTLEEVIALTRDQPLRFEPGTKFDYSNSGYTLLGYVIERVTGRSYADHLRESIFEPLGMRGSGYDTEDPAIGGRAQGYVVVGGRWERAPYISMSIPHAAGALYSTIDDLLIWDRALADAKVIGPESLQAMFTDHGGRYGFGWTVANPIGTRVQTHTGQINGFHAIVCRYPEDGVVIVVLANLWNARVWWIASELGLAYFGVLGGLPRACLEAWY